MQVNNLGMNNKRELNWNNTLSLSSSFATVSSYSILTYTYK